MKLSKKRVVMGQVDIMYILTQHFATGNFLNLSWECFSHLHMSCALQSIFLRFYDFQKIIIKEGSEILNISE